ncbi:MAG: hypothetical protein ABIH67_02525, partial [Candidatus Uhrbacteria bacterium]
IVSVFVVYIDGMISDNRWSAGLIVCLVCKLISYVLLFGLLDFSRSDWVMQWYPNNNVIMIALGQFLVLDLVALIFGLLTPTFNDKPSRIPR